MKSRIITIVNQKGGVGKTVTTTTLAGLMSQTGRSSLIIDCDPQGQTSTALGLNQEAGAFNLLVNTMQDPQQHIRMTGRKHLDIIPGDRSTASAQIVINAENRPMDAIRDILKPLMRSYHYIFIDTAPSVGGIQERAVYAADYVLIPSSTEFMSSNGLVQMMTNLKQLSQRGWNGKLLGILPTFYDESTRESKSTMEELRKEFGEAVLDPIHRATILRECCAEGRLVYEMDPTHRATREYSALLNYIIKHT
jgi:chromosome partitioning protein